MSSTHHNDSNPSLTNPGAHLRDSFIVSKVGIRATREPNDSQTLYGTFTPRIPLGKSFTFRVTSIRPATSAVARIIASGILILICLRTTAARSATALETGRH